MALLPLSDVKIGKTKPLPQRTVVRRGRGFLLSSCIQEYPLTGTPLAQKAQDHLAMLPVKSTPAALAGVGCCAAFRLILAVRTLTLAVLTVLATLTILAALAVSGF